MADAIEARTGTRPELIPGSGGVFDVVVDGRTIYSKHETGRFPGHDEILKQLSS